MSVAESEGKGWWGRGPAARIGNAMTETVAEILDAYRRGALKPEDAVARSFARIRRHGDPAIFIALREEADVVAEAKALARDGNMALPLYAIPVALKDNIAGKRLPTTPAGPPFAYRPPSDATPVATLPLPAPRGMRGGRAGWARRRTA